LFVANFSSGSTKGGQEDFGVGNKFSTKRVIPQSNGLSSLSPSCGGCWQRWRISPEIYAS